MEEIIEANLRLEAANYGFQLVNSRLQADVVLAGSAGLLKKEGFPFDSCMPFYSFDVIKQQPKHRKVTVFRLSRGVPNDIPCIRLAVARQILTGLRDGLDAADANADSKK
jgi:hypothetical protein